MPRNGSEMIDEFHENFTHEIVKSYHFNPDERHCLFF